MTQKEYFVSFFLQDHQAGVRLPRELSDEEAGMVKAGNPEETGLGLVIGADLLTFQPYWL